MNKKHQFLAGSNPTHYKMKNSDPNPTQLNPWVNPTHVHLWSVPNNLRFEGVEASKFGQTSLLFVGAGVNVIGTKTQCAALAEVAVAHGSKQVSKTIYRARI